MATVAQEFHISVTPVGENQYLLKTELVASGVPAGEELVLWPIEDWLAQAAPLLGFSPSQVRFNHLEDNLETDSTSTRSTLGDIWDDLIFIDYRCEESKDIEISPVSPSSDASVAKLAQEIYHALFQGTLANSWTTARQIAQAQQEVLLLRLIIPENPLKYLPWEYLAVGECLWNAKIYREEEVDFSTLDSSDAEDWELMADEDFDRGEDEEDTAFISGLLTKFPHPSEHQPERRETELAKTTVSSAAEENIATFSSEVPITTPQFPPTPISHSPIRQHKKLLLFSWGFLILTCLSFLFLRDRWLKVGFGFVNYLPKETSTTPLNAPVATPSANINQTSTSALTTMAIADFRQGNFVAGQYKVEALLNRGAIPQAKTALAVIPQEKRNQPAISFLYGRLAWQAVQAGNKNYSLDQARRYWEIAVKGNPQSPLYHNALGFAYYAQGNINRANQAWFEALYRAQEQQPKAKTSPSVTAGKTTREIASKDALNAYAGLALILMQSAQKQPVEQRSRLVNEAIKLRQKVIHDDPLTFQPQALQSNWLWPKQAVQDWRSLLQLKSSTPNQSKLPLS